MFSKNIFASYSQDHEQLMKEEILILIDLALDTKDEEWFTELRKKLEMLCE